MAPSGLYARLCHAFLVQNEIPYKTYTGISDFFCIWKITEFMPTCLRGAFFETQCNTTWSRPSKNVLAGTPTIDGQRMANASRCGLTHAVSSASAAGSITLQTALLLSNSISAGSCGHLLLVQAGFHCSTKPPTKYTTKSMNE